jgi:UDP-glucuronate decarboxylase
MMNTPEHVVGPMNLGNPIEFTMIELAELVLKYTGSSSKISYQALPQDDPRQRQPDITYARQQLDWEPKIFLDEGLQKTIAYFKEII